MNQRPHLSILTILSIHVNFISRRPASFANC